MLEDSNEPGIVTAEAIHFFVAGSPRRCGGQGDILAGLLGVFSFWAFNAQANGALSKNCPLAPGIVASLGASMVGLFDFYMGECSPAIRNSRLSR